MYLLGWSQTPFTIKDYRYDYPVLFDDLRDDVLIGMDFMCDFKVKLDMVEMTMKLGPRQVVDLHTS